MQQIKTLVFMQLKDKIDVSWMYSFKARLRTIVLSVLKFILITGIYTAVLYGASTLGLFYYSDMPQIMCFVLSVVLILSLLSCTYGLMKALYYADDNRVLITLPISTSKIFISKLLVFYFYELKRSISFTIPILLGCAINISMKGFLHWTSYIWMIFPLIFIIALPVLFGALLSIPLMYIYRFVNKYSFLKGILTLVLFAFGIFIAIYIIGLVPNRIDLMNQWPDIRKAIINFLTNFESKVYIMSHLTRTLIGQKHSMVYSVDGWTVFKTAILIIVSITLAVISYFIVRPIFLNMMSKNFEFNKNEGGVGKNTTHPQIITFNLKELKISLRSMEISFNYIIIYILVPLLILLLNKIFMAIDKKPIGYTMTYAFNILLILLPLLTSNSLIATLYSKEGRAGYIKKTKPVKPIMPLLAKLSFNIILSCPSLVASSIIFGNYAKFSILAIVLLTFALIFLHYGHIFYCATLDIMNPQNELYATSGEVENNMNETKASIVAFVLAFVFALISFKLFDESLLYTGSYTQAALKLMLIAAVICAYYVVSFFLKVKAFYGEK